MGVSMEFKLDPLIVQGLNTQARKDKFLRAVLSSENAVNSAEFIDWFMAAKFTQLGSHSHKKNDELLKMLLVPVQFNYSVIHRSWWKRWSSVIGYTQDNFKTKGPDIFTYGDSFDGMSIGGLSNNLTHEICHALNFSHSFEWSKERDKSLPYQVGNAVERLINGKL